MRLYQSLLMVSSCIASTALSAQEPVALSDRFVRVGDLADVGPHEQPEIDRLIVAAVPDGTQTIELSTARQATLLRRRMPGRRLSLRYDRAVIFAAPASRPESEALPPGPCYALGQDLPAGRYVTDDVLRRVACKGDSTMAPPFRFDAAAGSAMPTRALPVGTYLGPLVHQSRKPVQAGKQVSLTVVEGPVRIERQVRTIQPSRIGQSIFVRAADGQILSAPLAASAFGGTHR